MNRIQETLDSRRPEVPARRLPSQVGGDVRWSEIRRVRAAIARGKYETEERWQATLDRILEALGR